MIQRGRLLNVLIVAHDAKATGGVNNFLRILRRELRGEIKATRFSNGRRSGETGKFNTIRRMVWDYLRFCVTMLSRRIDILHINPTLDLSSLPRELVFAILATVLSPRTKNMLFYRGWDWDALNVIKQSPLRFGLYKFAHKRIHRILVLSEEFRQALIAIGVPSENVFVISTMFESAPIQEVLLLNDINRPRRSIVFLSRFIPAKGGAELIEAFAKVRTDFPDLQLIMAGDGPSRAHWESLAEGLQLKDTIVFTGYVRGRNKMGYLADAEIFALPTTHPEGMPNAILEAMASGCAILATPVAGIRDVVEHNANGYLISDRDVSLIEEGLRSLLSDRRRLREIGIVNHKKAWSNWASEIISRRILRHYEGMVN